MRTIAATLGLIAAGALANAGPVVFVPAWSKIWLAGMPDGTLAGGGDSAPAESPILVTGLSLSSGYQINFTVTGEGAHGPGKPMGDGDGFTLSSHNFGAQFGMSDLGAPLASLIGVFLTNAQPDLALPPPTLTWAAQSFGNYLTLSPALQQPFFIGDGLTDTGQAQWITAPTGATRLFLGTLDGIMWNDNPGGYTASLTGGVDLTTETPEPSTAVLLGTALIGLGLWGRHLRRA